MSSLLSIGDFARATHLTVKMLRHYHSLGILIPTEVDASTGFRRYSVDQIRIAQVVRRLRDLDVPLDEIRAILAADDLEEREGRMRRHLLQLADQADRAHRNIVEVLALLEDSPETAVDLRVVPAALSASITADIDVAEGGPWLQGAIAEIDATLRVQHRTATGHPGAIYSDKVFTNHKGTSTVFVPCDGDIVSEGRVVPFLAPAAELAILRHSGPPINLDRTYGDLAEYVAKRSIGVEGPMREYYVTSARETNDPSQWLTDIAWPVFITRAASPSRP